MGDRYNLRSRTTPTKRALNRDLHSKVKSVLQLQWLKAQETIEEIPENVTTEIDRLASETVAMGIDKIDAQTLDSLGETLAEVVRGWQQQESSNRGNISSPDTPAYMINQNLDDPGEIDRIYQEAVQEVIAASNEEATFPRTPSLTYLEPFNVEDDDEITETVEPEDASSNESNMEKLQQELIEARNLIRNMKEDNKDLKIMAERSLKDQYELTDENEELQRKLRKSEKECVTQTTQLEELKTQMSQFQKENQQLEEFKIQITQF